MNEIEDRVRRIVHDLLEGVSPAALHCDADLFDLGLTSLSLVRLMLETESAFAITFPDEALMPANFRSVRKITDLVEAIPSQALHEL